MVRPVYSEVIGYGEQLSSGSSYTYELIDFIPEPFTFVIRELHLALSSVSGDICTLLMFMPDRGAVIPLITVEGPGTINDVHEWQGRFVVPVNSQLRCNGVNAGSGGVAFSWIASGYALTLP